MMLNVIQQKDSKYVQDGIYAVKRMLLTYPKRVEYGVWLSLQTMKKYLGQIIRVDFGILQIE